MNTSSVAKRFFGTFFIAAAFIMSFTIMNAKTRSLHLLHLADAEASTPATVTAPNFAALIDAMVAEGDQLGVTNLILSSGDNYIPSPFLSAAGDGSMRQVFRDATGNPLAREGNGYADIRIHNILGVEASAIGNHEFDLGTSFFGDMMRGDIRSASEARFIGATFPYLSANLDFSGDGSLAGLYTDEILPNTDFITYLDDLGNPADKKIAPATIIDKGDYKIGVVGATTPIVESISSTGGVVAKQPGGGTNNMKDLAMILQPYIDELRNNHNIDIIIVVSHMQQLSYERELITHLKGVDIVVGGGSNTILADNNDRLMEGDNALDTYPIVTQNADGEPALIVNTDGGYKYVGRLLVDFDANGVIDLGSLNPDINGAWAADQMSVEEFFPTYEDAFANPDSRAARVKKMTDGIRDVIVQKDGNTFGWTDVFLEGRRTEVRTGETNLGNLSADANLWMAKKTDNSVVVSIKNGGGIRAAIGEIVSTGTDRYEERPPLANPVSGKMEGEVSQLDIENSLRFNNGLTLFTLTAEQLIEVLEHGVSATQPGATPGQFPQVGGVKFQYDPSNEPYSRLTKAWLVDMDGLVLDMLFENGEIVGNPERPVRCVALNFLVNNGGDNYPFPEFEAENPTFFNKLDLVNPNRSGNATFANDGSEQDALAEYLHANFNTKENAYRKLVEGRIVNLQNKSMLHLLHHSDAEGSSDVLETAPNFAALVDEFVRQGNELGVTTIQLASGDNYIPSPFFSASGDRSMREIFREATGNPMAREGEGYADIRIHNILGIDASALGNHEFDLGTNTLSGLMRGDIRSENEARFIGTAFPYLSSTLDFSGDGNLAGLYTDEIIPNTLFATSLSNLAHPADKKIAPATIINRNGELFGVIGATTTFLEQISSVGGVKVKDGIRNSEDMMKVAEVLQPYIDRMRFELGINKIILVTHLQQLSYEKELIGYLEGVDIVIAGGSSTILANQENRLWPGDEASEAYPIVTQNADGEPALIVNSDGSYKYVGRLLVEFDALGVINVNSLDPEINGPQITDNQEVAKYFGSRENAFANPVSRAARVKTICDGIGQVIISKDGNTFGWTDTYIEGRREYVRTQEATLGNLSADANLWWAKQQDPSTMVSLKNGGGIRASIGQIVETEPGIYEERPPVANPLAGKMEGEISQLDIENTLRFNNGLVLVTLTAEQLLEVLNHGVAASVKGATPGQFPQVGGVKFTYDMEDEAGMKVKDAWLIDFDGNELQRLAMNGNVAGDPNRPIRVVSLNFLVDIGGDGYPYPEFRAENPQFFNYRNLVMPERSGIATFADNGTEQDAMAEYLHHMYSMEEMAYDKTIEGRIGEIPEVHVMDVETCKGVAAHVGNDNLIEGGSGDFIVSWHPAHILDGHNAYNPMVTNPLYTTDMTVTVKDNLTGVVVEESLTLSVNSGASVRTSPIFRIIAPNTTINLNNNVLISGGEAPYKIHWYDENDNMIADPANHMPLGFRNVYYYQVEDENGCLSPYNRRNNFYVFVLPRKEVYEDAVAGANGSISFVYPNPASDNLNIFASFGANEKANVSVFDMLGNKVSEYNFAGEVIENSIDISALTTGVYVLRIETGSDVMTQQFIVK